MQNDWNHKKSTVNGMIFPPYDFLYFCETSGSRPSRVWAWRDMNKKSIIMIEKKKAREDANTMSKKQMYDLRLAAPQENTLSTTKKKIMLNRISKYF